MTRFILFLTLTYLAVSHAADPLTDPAHISNDPNALLKKPIHKDNNNEVTSPFAPRFNGAVNDKLSANGREVGVDGGKEQLGASNTTRGEGLAEDAGPEVKVYGPAQGFWDKHPRDGRLVPLFRYWNPAVRNHFYTVDFGVFGSGREGWVYQGIQLYVYKKQVAGSVPLYRYWSLKLLDDYYTISSTVPASTGYKLKGIACYVLPKAAAGAVPLYRYFNREIADHYYTHDYNVMQHGRDGWVLQGIAAYGYPHPSEFNAEAGSSAGSNAANSNPNAPRFNASNASPDIAVGASKLDSPTAYIGKVDGIAKPSGNATHAAPSGPAPLIAQASADTPLLVPMYRYWNSIYRDHFYSTLWSELGAGGHGGWEYQGVQALVYENPQPGTKALHRYWNVRTLDHFYTTNFAALGKGKEGWRYEGVACYIDAAKGKDNTPLYRYFSDSFNDHFYTTRFIGPEARSWKYEGVQGYVKPSFFTDC